MLILLALLSCTLDTKALDEMLDQDGDGFDWDEDCDDDDANASPSGAETCDGVDQDCDGRVDEGTLTEFYTDSDGDGFGDVNAAPFQACDAPVGMANDNTDCDDAAAGINPDAQEVCDDVDQDCDAQVDEDLEFITYYVDADDDGYGDPSDPGVESCLPVYGSVPDNTDCDDGDENYNPGATDTDCEDWDCDGEVIYDLTPESEGGIQAAVDAASSGDAICLAPGTYVENVQVSQAIKLIGAHPAGEGDGLSCDEAWYPTILNGDAAGSVLTLTANEEGGTIVLKRLRLEGGKAYRGGGLDSAWTGELELSALRVQGNHADRGWNSQEKDTGGGGVFITQAASLQWSDSAVCDNVAEDDADDDASMGGGAIIGRDDPYQLYVDMPVTLTNLHFEGNTATSHAGGLLLEDVEATLTGLSFEDNRAGLWREVIGVGYNGGCLGITHSSVEAVGLTFLDCATRDYGGAFYVYTEPDEGDQEDVVFRDLVVQGSSANEGGAIYVGYDTLTIVDALLQDNHADAQVHAENGQPSLRRGIGGVAKLNLGATLILESVEVVDNSAISDGGGIYVHGHHTNDLGSTLIVNDSRFTNNLAGSLADGYGVGGAIQLDEVDSNVAIITDTTFEGNFGRYGGGAIAAEQDDLLVLTRVNFIGNSAGEGPGGAVSLRCTDSASMTWENVLFEDNEAGTEGGALYAARSSVDITQALFRSNKAWGLGGAVSLYSGTTSTSYNTDCDDGRLTEVSLHNTSVVENAGSDAALSVDALSTFYADWVHDDANWPTAASGAELTHLPEVSGLDPLFGDYRPEAPCDAEKHLLEGSPLVDAGDPEVLDRDGTRSDIGRCGGPNAER